MITKTDLIAILQHELPTPFWARLEESGIIIAETTNYKHIYLTIDNDVVSIHTEKFYGHDVGGSYIKWEHRKDVPIFSGSLISEILDVISANA